MSILTKNQILKEIQEGNIKINPFNKERIGPASIDLSLDNKFRVFKKIHGTFAVKEEANHEDVTEYIEVEDYFLLMPGESVLGITKEKICLPQDICGWLEGRSTFARLGLTVHVTASFMHPGIKSKQVLEINNVSSIPLELYPGTYICQFIFQRCEGKAKYTGKYRKQERP
ncbi:MAG: dCTP deaminase [Elusimicrobiota bacterium]